MSIPGTHGAKVERQHEVEISPFSMSRTPVTHELYCTVMGQAAQDKDQALPVVSVTWLDAVMFCNHPSELLGLDPVYEFGDEPDDVVVRPSGGFRLPTDAEWQFACKGSTRGYRYGDLDQIGWYDGNPDEECTSLSTSEILALP